MENRIPSLDRFIYESENISEGEVSIDKDGKSLSYWDSGNKTFDMPLNSLLDALRVELKMTKKVFPSDKTSYDPFTRGQGTVKLPDNAELYWYKSSPPLRVLSLKANDKDVLLKYKQMLDNIVSKYGTQESASQADIFDKLPTNLKLIFKEAWMPPIGVANIVSLLSDKSVKIDYYKSGFNSSNLPNGFRYIPDPKTTNFTVVTNREKFLFTFHTYNTWSIISW